MFVNVYLRTNMPAKSKAQQKVMAMALAYKRGSLKNASAGVKKLAKSMSEKELEKYASTDTSKLPDKVTNENVNRGGNKMSTKLIKRLISETVKEVLNEAAEEQRQTPKFTSEQQREFFESIKRFNEHSGNIYRRDNISDSYKQIKSIVEFASQHLVEESGEWFDNVTAGRHSRRLKESFKVFEKTVSEVMKLQQRLESAYEDIGETLNKYYEIQENAINRGNVTESKKKVVNEAVNRQTIRDYWVDQFKSFMENSADRNAAFGRAGVSSKVVGTVGMPQSYASSPTKAKNYYSKFEKWITDIANEFGKQRGYNYVTVELDTTRPGRAMFKFTFSKQPNSTQTVPESKSVAKKK